MRCLSPSRLALGSLFTLSALLVGTPAAAHGGFPEAKQILLPADRPQHIILATTFGLVSSDDDGGTWLFSCEHGLGAYAAPYLLGAPPSRRLFALTGGGLIYSDDDACTWQAAGGTLSNVLPYAFAVDPSTSRRVYAVGVPSSGGRQGDNIYVSDDGGLSFGEPVFTSPERSAVLTVLVAPSQPDRLFASMFSAPENHPLLLRSDDAGAHWEVAADLVDSLGDNPFELLAIDALDANKIYARVLEPSAETLATSDDGGLSFVPSVSIPGKLNAFLKLASGTILVAGTAGTEAVGYRSKDDGQSFEPWIGAPHVHALAERNGKLYVAGDHFADGFAIAESDDEGAHLRPLAAFDQVQAVTSCVADACAESCAYYAGTGLWPEAVCGLDSPPPDAGQPHPGEPPGEAGGASGAAGAEMDPIDEHPAGGGGAAGVAETTETPRLRVSGGGCACGIAGRAPANAGMVLLLGGSCWAARRRRRANR